MIYLSKRVIFFRLQAKGQGKGYNLSNNKKNDQPKSWFTYEKFMQVQMTAFMYTNGVLKKKLGNKENKFELLLILTH